MRRIQPKNVKETDFEHQLCNFFVKHKQHKNTMTKSTSIYDWKKKICFLHIW